MKGAKLGNSVIYELEDVEVGGRPMKRVTLESGAVMVLSKEDLTKQAVYANNQQNLGLARRQKQNRLPRKARRNSNRGAEKRAGGKSKPQKSP